MTSASSPAPATALRPGLVLGTSEQECTVVVRGRRAAVPYAAPFPGPRTERVLPGHLVAVATAAAGVERVVWRWYDAVVLGVEGDQVRLWEPVHGEVLARPRDPRRARPPGSRAYLSAGLPGADWWVAGPAVGEAEQADEELDEVRRFFTDHGLWDRLT